MHEALRHTCGSRPLAAEKKATLNFKSEPHGGLEQHPGRERQPGSLPFPLHTADPCCRIMGGITSSPAVPLLRQTWKHNNIAGPSSCSSGGHGTAPAAVDPSLPSSSYCSAAAMPGSHTCIYWHLMQIMASTDISNRRFSPPGKQQSKQLPHAELTRLWRKFTLHIIQLFACTWRLHTKPETPNLQWEALFKIYCRTSGIQYSGVY